jgi:phosphoribosylanthranilate isomerase
MTPLIKICGTTSRADACLASEAGADFVGVVLHPASPRFLDPGNVPLIREAAQNLKTAGEVPLVLVTVNLSRPTLLNLWTELRPHALQLHGDESPELVRELVLQGARVWKVLSGNAQTILRDAKAHTSAGAEALVLDAREVTAQGVIYGGTGHIADWNLARRLVEEGYRVMLAGGLTPDNVARAIDMVQPWAVDVVSGVEARKGVKDADKVRAFTRAVAQSDTTAFAASRGL